MVEKYLNNFEYQPGFKVEKIHYYGLTNRIQKTAYEQIDFLKALYYNKLDIRESTLDIIKQGMLQKSPNNYKLYLRTGMGPIKNEKYDSGIVWHIGFIEKDSNIWFFAANVVNDDELVAYDKCKTYTMEALRQLLDLSD